MASFRHCRSRSAESAAPSPRNMALAVADWRELLGRVDLVSVCSPAITHSSIVRAFLNAGAHVLVEKPIATSVEEADALIGLAEKTGLVLTVGHQERFVFARTGLLDQSETPVEIQCWREGPWSGRGADVSVVLDLMIHDLDLVHMLVGQNVVDVAARGTMRKSRFADAVSAELTFENGTRAKIATSLVSSTRRGGRRAVYRDDGTVEITDFVIPALVKNTTPPR